MHKPDATVIGLVGGTGDLARRMVIPGCFHLMVAGLLPDECRIVGLSLDDLDDDGFKDVVRQSLEAHARADLDDAAWARFAAMLSFGRTQGAADYKRAFAAAEKALGGSPRRLFHLAVPPSAAAAVSRPRPSPPPRTPSCSRPPPARARTTTSRRSAPRPRRRGRRARAPPATGAPAA